MAGMFYTLEEVAEKLNKTKDEVKGLVEQGALREFRDGPASYFKIEEVETFASGEGAAAEAPEGAEAATPEAVEAEESVPEAADAETFQPEEDLPSLEFAGEEIAGSESEDVGAEQFDAAAIDELVEGMPAAEAAPVAEVSEAKPKKKAKKQRSKKVKPKAKPKAKPKVKRTVKRQRRSFGQWLLYGLTEDSFCAIFVLVLLFCVVLSVFAAVGYGLYFMYVNY